MPHQYSFHRAPVYWLIGSAIFCAAVLAGLSTATAGASELRRTAIVRAVEQARPSVVNIHGRKNVRSDEEKVGMGDSLRQVNGMGTGVVIDHRGYIITNYHVIEGVSRIQVTLADKQTVVGQLIANDPKTDLAVIKIPVDRELPVIRIGTSTDLMPGEPVVAMGNAYGYEDTVTRGIISALHRDVQVSDEQKYYDLIQTDASINPGNSGGPLLNIDGEMIGINVAVRVGAQGIAFAIPIDEAIDVAARLMSVERLEKKVHGVTGKSYFVDNTPRFVLLSVRKGSPAEQSGLAAGDVITMVGSERIERALDFERALLGRSAGEQVDISVARGGQPMNLALVLASAPSGGYASVDRTWEALGVMLEPVSRDDFRRFNSRYRGGLKVASVRADGPAAKQGIRRGDVLVGMHIWETISLENVSYILARPDFEEIQPVKFYILRGTETLYGHMNVSAGSIR